MYMYVEKRLVIASLNVRGYICEGNVLCGYMEVVNLVAIKQRPSNTIYQLHWLLCGMMLLLTRAASKC